MNISVILSPALRAFGQYMLSMFLTLALPLSVRPRFSLKNSVLIILLFIGFIPAIGWSNTINYGVISNQVLDRLQTNDILIFGEDHENSMSRELLMAILEKGFALGEIDGFTTEYVLEEVEADFQKFLMSPTASPNSEEEAKIFDRISNEFRYVWFKDPTNKVFFRFLREQKLKYGDKISICGNDILPSKWRPNGDTATNLEELNRNLRMKRFDSMPANLLSTVISKFMRPKEELINDLNINYDREPLMALRSARCLSGRKKSVIHMGGSHAWSMNFSPPKEPDNKAWEATSHFLPTLLPGKRIETINLMTPDPKNPESVNQMKTLIGEMNGGEIVQFLMTGRTQINSYIQARSPDYPDNGPLSIWDFTVFTYEMKKTPLWSK